ncbi:MAG: hypothetical protein HZB80_01420 [Deltaproteobacteria bacterium]|nr:hypothetical protein [Deltaproteobacteria bacterium]
MDGKSFDTKHDRLQRVKEPFHEVFAENQVDWKKLRVYFGDDIVFANERYVLNGLASLMPLEFCSSPPQPH